MEAGSKMEKYIYSKSWYGRRIVVKQLDDEHHSYVGFDTQEFAAAYNRNDCIEILKEVAKKLASLNK